MDAPPPAYHLLFPLNAAPAAKQAANLESDCNTLDSVPPPVDHNTKQSNTDVKPSAYILSIRQDSEAAAERRVEQDSKASLRPPRYHEIKDPRWTDKGSAPSREPIERYNGNCEDGLFDGERGGRDVPMGLRHAAGGNGGDENEKRSSSDGAGSGGAGAGGGGGGHGDGGGDEDGRDGGDDEDGRENNHTPLFTQKLQQGRRPIGEILPPLSPLDSFAEHTGTLARELGEGNRSDIRLPQSGARKDFYNLLRGVAPTGWSEGASRGISEPKGLKGLEDDTEKVYDTKLSDKYGNGGNGGNGSGGGPVVDRELSQPAFGNPRLFHLPFHLRTNTRTAQRLQGERDDAQHIYKKVKSHPDPDQDSSFNREDWV